jgi:hypothetical protein
VKDGKKTNESAGREVKGNQQRERVRNIISLEPSGVLAIVNFSNIDGMLPLCKANARG